MPIPPQTNIIYIAGTVRSGTTLLGRVLAHQLDAVYVGEIKQLWVCIERGHLCECGLKYLDCPFWREVLTRVFGGLGQIDAKELNLSSILIDTPQHALKYYLSEDRHEIIQQLARFRMVMRSVYRAVSDVSGERTIIDASKSALYGQVLSGFPEIDLRSVHLIRDSRAVAFSAQRKRVDPSKPAGTMMPQLSTLRTCIMWNATHAALEAKSIGKRSVRLRYEDFASNPANALNDVHKVISDSNPIRDIDFTKPVQIPSGHSVAGNPAKFERSLIVKPDDEWKTEMQIGSRALVTAMTLPLLVRYGYRI